MHNNLHLENTSCLVFSGSFAVIPLGSDFNQKNGNALNIWGTGFDCSFMQIVFLCNAYLLVRPWLKLSTAVFESVLSRILL